MIKYEATVLEVGPLVTEFTEAGILVFFNNTAPEELREFTIIHDGTELKGELIPGDKILLDGEEFEVLAVGDVANDNFANLGHLVMKFNGMSEVEMPGDVCVESKPLPIIRVGSVFQVLGN